MNAMCTDERAVVLRFHPVAELLPLLVLALVLPVVDIPSVPGLHDPLPLLGPGYL